MLLFCILLTFLCVWNFGTLVKLYFWFRFLRRIWIRCQLFWGAVKFGFIVFCVWYFIRTVRVRGVHGKALNGPPFCPEGCDCSRIRMICNRDFSANWDFILRDVSLADVAIFDGSTGIDLQRFSCSTFRNVWKASFFRTGIFCDELELWKAGCKLKVKPRSLD